MTDPQLSTFGDQLRQGRPPELLKSIEQAVLARQEARGGHADWGRLCEEAGLLNLAFREFQLARRDDPRDAPAVLRLAHYYRERGETGRAAEVLEGLLQSQPVHEEALALLVQVLRDDNALPRARAALDRAVRAGLAPDKARALAVREPPDREAVEAEASAELDPADADCTRFQTLFSGREDVHARQWAQGSDSGYSPVHEPLTPAVVRNHLLGTYTVGVYPIRLDGTCTFFALDLDIDRPALEQAHGRPAVARTLRDSLRQTAAQLLAALRQMGLPPLFEDSGYKGRHFWVFLEQPEPAEVLHQLGRFLLARFGSALQRGLHLEFFPKQGALKGKGLGNLIKLPLGIHRRTGRRALLLDDAGRPLGQPLAVLRGWRRLSRRELHAAIERLRGQAPSPSPPAAVPGEKGPPELAPGPTGPPPPPPPPIWTEADFQADPAVCHLLACCPVLAELKRGVDEHRRLAHEEQLVLIHTLGHLEAGPLAVNYLFNRCLDVGREKFLKDRLKGNPVSCPSIRKKIAHVTRRVNCRCEFDFAPDRYPTPVLHLLTQPASPPPPPPSESPDAANLALRFAACTRRRDEIECEYTDLRRALLVLLASLPERCVTVPGGRYRLEQKEGVEELIWEVISSQ